MAHATPDQPPNQIATQAYQIVERYDGTDRAKREQELRDLLGSDSNAYDGYVRMLNEEDQHRERARNEPQRSRSHLDESREPNRDEAPHRPRTSSPSNRGLPRRSKREKSFDDQSSNGRRKRRRHRHRHSPPSSPSDSSSDSDSEPRHERPDSSLFPWTAQPTVRPELDHRAILEQTMAARNNFVRGGKVRDAVRSLMEHSNLPNFPSSKWKTVLSDDYMDLRKVIGAVESSVGDTRETTVIGGLEIGYGREPPSKPISSASNWASAFELYRGAVVYAFPHRNEELLAYRDYLNNTFRVFGPQYHSAVIEFDQRCRILYSRTHARALSDITQFATEYARLTVHVAESAASSSRVSSHTSPDPVCHRYNFIRKKRASFVGLSSVHSTHSSVVTPPIM